MLSRSIRLRLQFWFAFMQVGITLVGGCYLYYLDGSNRLQQMDASLERRLTPLHFAARDSLDVVSKQPSSWQMPPNVEMPSTASRTDFLQSALLGSGSELFSQQWVQEAVYFVIWSQSGEKLVASNNLPGNLSKPQEKWERGPIAFRTVGENREAYQVTAANDVVLVGQSLAILQQAHYEYLWQLLTLAGGLLLVGLLATWKIIDRAINPLESITREAAQLSVGNLEGRLSAPNPEDEVGKLVAALNATLARLNAAFARQKRFVAHAAHELRTPLSVMLSEAQAVLNRPRSNEEYQASLKHILRAIQRLRNLSESLLAMARMDIPNTIEQRERFDLKYLVDACIELVNPLASEKLMSLSNRIPLTTLSGVPEHITSLFTNLLSNAIEYGSEGSEIRIWTSVDPDRPHDVAVHVSNIGDTIAEEDKEHLFECFYRVDKSRSRGNNHAGLGLAICQRVVEEHHGQISVASNDGLTVFTVWLPTDDINGHLQWPDVYAVKQAEMPSGAIDNQS